MKFIKCPIFSCARYFMLFIQKRWQIKWRNLKHAMSKQNTGSDSEVSHRHQPRSQKKGKALGTRLPSPQYQEGMYFALCRVFLSSSNVLIEFSPKKLPNPWILRKFTKILLKNLFYQISIKIVEILTKVKK
jgi:hypothetical protein